MAQWYRTGTADVTNGSNVVSGTGTFWGSAANKPIPGDAFIGPDGVFHEIISVDHDGQITLFDAYAGASQTNQSYAIMRSAGATTNTRIAAQVTDVLNTLGNRVTVSTSAPSAGQGNDGDIWIVVS